MESLWLASFKRWLQVAPKVWNKLQTRDPFPRVVLEHGQDPYLALNEGDRGGQRFLSSLVTLLLCLEEAYSHLAETGFYLRCLVRPFDCMKQFLDCMKFSESIRYCRDMLDEAAIYREY
ncbi:hypothetical protein TNCV_3940581 [Trichonephila clavipes]|uniref:Uncharacterized protein n=1 Tax=Trichonephila clavipes TaxID=2585209 RepID=A0A8X6VVM2_TRICX|nr:hypothetical protein TNCV_3940581 [Trichonephila clavipes]